MHFINRLLSLIAPLQCVGCNKEGSLLCVWCRPDLIERVPERCVGCMKIAMDSRTCKKCRQQYRLPEHVWVHAVYDGYMKILLHSFKFKRAISAADTLADLLNDVLPYLPPEAIFVPIPTAPPRVRVRGYDQAKLLARELARKNKMMHVSMLERINNSRQVGAPRAVRKKQLSKAFAIKKTAVPKSAMIVLVDDIHTTGGTLIAATTTLKKAGYKNIQAAIVAQAI